MVIKLRLPAEPVPAPVTTGSSAASVVPGEAQIAATGEEAKADRQAESASEPAPAAMPDVAAIERPATDQVVPEEQTWPVERIASNEQPATAPTHRPRRPNRLRRANRPCRSKRPHASINLLKRSKRPGPLRPRRLSNTLVARRPLPPSKPLPPTRPRGRVRKTTRAIPSRCLPRESRARSTRRRALSP